jgi:hypothetical protein
MIATKTSRRVGPVGRLRYLRKTDYPRISAGDARSCIPADKPVEEQQDICTVGRMGLVDMINP